MKTRHRHALWAVLAMLCVAAPAHAQTTAKPVVKASGNAPLVTLTREHGMVKGVTDTPLVRLYSDGHVAIHVPAYMKGAGFYEFQLQGAEFDRLMRDFEAADLMRFDTQAVRARHDAAVSNRRSSTGVRFVTTDSTTTRIDLNFAQFGAANGKTTSVNTRIEWPDLAVAAERYPQLSELTALASVEQRLLALVSDARRRPVKAPTRQ